MAEARRNMGLEILEGIRQLKRGEHGRIIRRMTTRRRRFARSRQKPKGTRDS